MLDLVANQHWKHVHQHLADQKESCAKKNVSQRPKIVKRIDNKNDLRHNVNEKRYTIDDKHECPQGTGAVVRKWTHIKERAQCNHPHNQSDKERAQSNGLLKVHTCWWSCWHGIIDIHLPIEKWACHPLQIESRQSHSTRDTRMLHSPHRHGWLQNTIIMSLEHA